MRRRGDQVAQMEAELERRLKELEHREVALQKISAAVMKNRPAAAPARSVDVDARLQEVEARENALKRISEVVERRRGELDVAVREAEERATAAEQRAAELEAQLEAQIAAVPDPPPAAERRGRFGRRSAADTRVRELEQEVEVLRGRIAELEHSSPEPPVLLPPHESDGEEDLEPLAVSGRPTLPQLEHLALEAERRGAPQAEEWTIYLPLLREHAWLDGTIPPHFDDILRDVFGASF